MIYKFGDCSYYNHNNLQYLSEIVKENVNKEIQIELYREEKNLDEKDEKKDLINHKDIYYKVFKIVIIPKIWKGQGVLGSFFSFFPIIYFFFNLLVADLRISPRKLIYLNPHSIYFLNDFVYCKEKTKKINELIH